MNKNKTNLTGEIGATALASVFILLGMLIICALFGGVKECIAILIGYTLTNLVVWYIFLDKLSKKIFAFAGIEAIAIVSYVIILGLKGTLL